MNFLRLLFASSIVAIAGCASPYQCPIGYECLNSGDALNAARENGGNSETVLPHDGDFKKIENKSDRKKNQSEPHKIMLSGKALMRGKPIYIPDSPMRVTVMPSSSDNVMIGAHEIYFPIPGGFSIGIEEGKSSSAGKIFSPIDPNKQLGFDPVQMTEEERVMPQR